MTEETTNRTIRLRSFSERVGEIFPGMEVALRPYLAEVDKYFLEDSRYSPSLNHAYGVVIDRLNGLRKSWASLEVRSAIPNRIFLDAILQDLDAIKPRNPAADLAYVAPELLSQRKPSYAQRLVSRIKSFLGRK